MPKIGNLGEKLHLTIRQGITLSAIVRVKLNGKPLKLHGCTVRAQIRKDPLSSVAYVLTCVILDPDEGKFRYVLPDHVSESMPYLGPYYEPENQYVWDLEIAFPDGSVVPVLYGKVLLYPGITHQL